MWAIGPASSPMKAHAGRSRRPGDGVCDVTSAPAVQNTTSQATADPGRDASDAADRLRLKTDPTPTGQVDGGWWPHSTDLAAELPDLFSALAPQIGPIERVGYHLGDWDAAPRKIRFEGAVARLGGYHWQRAATVDVLTARRTLTLRVVPPATAPDAAQDALAAAAEADDTPGAGGAGASSARRRRSRGDRSSRHAG
jgi:Family of unknown function (DUF5994)